MPRLLEALQKKHPLPIPLLLTTWGAHYLFFVLFYPAIDWNIPGLKEHALLVSLGTSVLISWMLYQANPSIMAYDMTTFLSSSVGGVLSFAFQLFLTAWTAPVTFPILLIVGLLSIGNGIGFDIWRLVMLAAFLFFVFDAIFG